MPQSNPIPHSLARESQSWPRPRLGVIEPVPIGEPVTYCHCMIVYAKKNGEPRRTVDFQAIENINATYIQLKVNSREITMGLIYRPPVQSHSIDDKLYEQLSEISCQNESIIFGDLNLLVIKWGCPLISRSGHDFYVNLLDSSFHHVEHPTQGNNILDIILSTE